VGGGVMVVITNVRAFSAGYSRRDTFACRVDFES